MQSVILGTAQWGLDYGITNASGRLPDAALADLVREARDLGVSSLDTAPVYGDAENRIRRAAFGFAVQTKVSAGGLSPDDIVVSVGGSLERLGVDRLSCLLVHDWHDLDEEGRRVAAVGLDQVRRLDLATAVGISAYTVHDLITAGTALEQLDIVQVPVNVLDQRLDDCSALNSLRESGTRVQARSVFLQGVALSRDDTSAFGTHPDVVRLRRARAEADVDALTMCLGYVRSRPWVDEVVVATTSAAELRAVLSAWDSPPPAVDWAALASSDLDLIDPRRWARPNRGRMAT